MLAVSIDTPEEARNLARGHGLTFPLLSDPTIQVIRRYGMKGVGMEMADMGWLMIDREGRIRTKRIDRRFGDHVEWLLQDVRQAKARPRASFEAKWELLSGVGLRTGQ